MNDDAEYGFPLNPFGCNTMRLDKWIAVFGPPNPCEDEAQVTAEPEEEETKDDEDWFPEPGANATRQQRDGPDETTSCDPEVCRTASVAVCVDCTRCCHHCSCIVPRKRELAVPFRSFVCSPVVCKQLMCGDCTRCMDHCTCQWDKQKRILREQNRQPVEETTTRGGRKRLNWIHSRK